ncbi:Oidioi.mRNA.OKI2018_I69.chr1.g168.t2.cds [Oikopleura dioica]|uniref:non-specific serine/threonine protein kinase n=1 Tax=Oikopleura dioica TaxID=34765 RepID=A0ABN7SMR5_OIKDI|nr:Oidioi.mRNA.OKI2018_I69.chr1.g168.t2.cds [Oikopleura dioica]
MKNDRRFSYYTFRKDEGSLKDKVLEDRFRTVRLIGTGSFGEIYLGADLSRDSNSVDVAIKVEPKRLRGQLKFESHVYEILRSENGFPHLRKFGEDNILSVNYLAMDLLGPTVEDLFNFCDKSFSLKTILMLIEQLLCRLECIHSKGLVHRDIKPDNLVMGLNHMSKTVMMIDFGIAKFFRKRNQPFDHILEDDSRGSRGIIGTPRYCSVNAHRGTRLSRRDDMESLAYVIVYFLKGKLPWQNIQVQGKFKKLEAIHDKKKNTNFSDYLSGFPKEFVIFVDYCRNLPFKATPDYMFLRNLFRCLGQKWNIQYDLKFDWSKQK